MNDKPVYAACQPFADVKMFIKHGICIMAIATSGARGSQTRAIAYFCSLLCAKAAQ
jgi:hypothetical protein